MDALEVLLGIGAILISLFVAVQVLDDFREVRKLERAQREVQCRPDQYLADAREMIR